MPKVIKECVDILLIMVIVLALGLAFLSVTKKDSTATQVGGFSAFVVKTGSMAAIEPIGSVVIAQAIPIHEVKLGDDLVFYKNAQTRVTHRVVGIGKDDVGKTILTTKGVNNQEADTAPVYGENIIGKVKVVMPNLGYLGVLLQQEPIYLVMGLAVVLLLYYIRELVLGRERK